MKSNPKPSQSGSFQLLKSPSNHSGKIRKTKSMTPESPKSKSRKISTDQVRRQSSRLSEKLENSMESAVESRATKRKILSDAPVNTKRFKDSRVRSVQDKEADLDDLSKEGNGKENEAQVGVELSLRSDNRPVTLTPAAHTRNNKGEVKVVDSEVTGSADNMQEIVNNDASMESCINAASPPTRLNESEILLCTFEVSGDEESKTFAAVWNETEWIYLVEQPSLARSPVSSDGGQASGDLETEQVDVETKSDDVDPKEDDSIVSDQDPTGQDIQGNDDIGNQEVADLESVSGPGSSSEKDDILCLKESKTDANDAENYHIGFEPEDPIDVKSSEELDVQAHNPRSSNLNEESTRSLSISNLSSSINFEETDAESITLDGVDMETVAEKLQIDAEKSEMNDTIATGMSWPNQDQEMEDDGENSADSAGDPNVSTDVDMTAQGMTSSGQTIHDVGSNQTSLDDSKRAGPSNRVENLSASSFLMPQDSERIHQYQRFTKIERVVPASDGKETVLTHESVRNYTLHLSSGRDASNFSCSQENMLDSLFHDEEDEELERILLAWNESQLRMPQSNSGQYGWNQQEDNNELYITAIVLVFFILFIARHLIEALPF